VESAEHVWIGEQISLEFGTGKVPAATEKLRIRLGGSADLGPTITYGQGIALGGDFYGVIGQPISTATDPEDIFNQGWLQMVLPYVPYERARILEIMQLEIDRVMEVYKKGGKVSAEYDKIGDLYSLMWSAETWLRYPRLAVTNFDHFGENAIKAYRTGHKVAVDEARLAAAEPKGSISRRLRLERAYAINAFADHFLTDLFSSGHLRVPRVEMYNNIGEKLTAGRLVRVMHNEDSRHGLYVRGVKTNPWHIYGDKMLLDPVSEDNRIRVTEATQTSADEVWAAFDGQPVTDFKALDQIPDIQYLLKHTGGENFSPLFKVNHPADKLPLRRYHLKDRKDVDYVSGWSPLGTLGELQSVDGTQWNHVRCFDLESRKFLGWLGVTSATDPYVAIVPDEKSAHGIAWYFDGGDELYLQKDTSGASKRYLGLSPGSRAGWGIKGGQRDTVIINADMTVSLSKDPKRLLCVDRMSDGNWGGAWTDGTSNRFVIQIELPLPVPNMN
jgi:hypothetical protein